MPFLTMETFSPVLSVFLLLFAGVLLRKLNVLQQSDGRVINSIIIYATVPALAFGIFYGQKLSWTLALVVAAGNAANVVSLLIARQAARALGLSRPRTGAFMMAASFGNTTFMGIPVVDAAFRGDPQALVVAMIYSELAMSLPVYTLGLWLASKYGGSHASIRDVLSPRRLPAIPAMALGALLTPLAIPEAVTGALERLGACTLPLAMISVGLMLSARSFEGSRGPILVAAAMKLFCMPVIMYAILTLFGVHGLARQVTLLQAGMPVSIIAGVMAARGGSDGPFVAAVTLVTTLGSVVSLPLLLTIIR